MENEPYVIVSISLASENRYLVELMEKRRLKPKTRSEKWAARDSFFGLDDDEHLPPYLFARSMVPIIIAVTATEFNRLQLRVGMEVRLDVVPLGV